MGDPLGLAGMFAVLPAREVPLERSGAAGAGAGRVAFGVGGVWLV